MILNAFAILLGFLSLIRLGLGLLILVLCARVLKEWTGAAKVEEGRTGLENRTYFLFQIAVLLLWLNIVSWPLMYMLLQSYVPEWPGVMCIYGVTQIGKGSVGVSRHLPDLLEVLQFAKPMLVFLSGAWFVLYLLNRQTRSAPITGRVLVLLMLTGLIAGCDAIAEISYVAIPKKEEVITSGCCTEVFDDASHTERFLPKVLVEDRDSVWLYCGYFGVNIGMIGALGICQRPNRRRNVVNWLPLLCLGGVLSAAVNAVFLVEAAAPRLLHLPFHHCPYDLIPQVPESMLAVGLFVAGFFFVEWAAVAAWLGRHAQTKLLLADLVQSLIRWAFLGYLCSFAMMTLMLVLA
jgi:hypothetical protein